MKRARGSENDHKQSTKTKSIAESCLLTGRNGTKTGWPRLPLGGEIVDDVFFPSPFWCFPKMCIINI